MDLIREIVATIATTALDVVPVAVFMLVYQRLVLKRQLVNPRKIFLGLGLVTIGLALLLLGVDKALFPAGRMMVRELAAGAASVHGEPAWTSYYGLYAFAFCIAFTAALAEPALLAIAARVSELSGGAIEAWGLRLAAAFGVAAGVAFGCIRIVTGLPLNWCIAAAFMIIIVQTLFAPRAIVPLAYDSGGVSTTAVTVPLVAALGLGLAELMPTRNPLLDGFGLIAFACLCPAISVLGYAQVAFLVDRFWRRRARRLE